MMSLLVLLALLFVGSLNQDKSPKAQPEATKTEHKGAEDAIAEYTLWLVLATGGLAVGTLVLAGYTRRLWVATVQLATDANESSARQLARADLQIERMTETIHQMRSSEERQLRAYVFIDESNWKEKGIEWPNGAAYILRLKNSGQTPAYKCGAWIGTVIAPLNDPPHPPEFPHEASEASRSTLGPNGGTMLLNTPSRILTDKEIVNLVSGTHAYYVFGRYEFTDAFARIRRGEFRMIRSDSGHNLNHHREGNHAD